MHAQDCCFCLCFKHHLNADEHCIHSLTPFVLTCMGFIVYTSKRLFSVAQ